MPGQRKKAPARRAAASRVEGEPVVLVNLHLEVESIRRLARSSDRTRSCGEDEVWEELVDNAEATLQMLELVHPENGRIRYELPVRKTLPVHVGMRVRLSLEVDPVGHGPVG